MNRVTVVLFSGFLLCAALQAQVEQLATSGDGRVLLFHSRFRLQTETDLGPLGKIYRWQDGQWTRLALPAISVLRSRLRTSIAHSSRRTGELSDGRSMS